MAGSLKLSYGGTDITLSPLANVIPDHNISTGKIIKEGITGTIYVDKRWEKVKDRLEFNNISKEDADYIKTWCQDGYTLTYTPDTDTPGTTYQVIIINDGNPFDWMEGTAADSKFRGSLMLREV